MGKKQVTKAEETKAEVNALGLLKHLNLAWVLDRPLDEGDVDILKARVTTSEDGEEWAGWISPYTRVDGSIVRGIVWGVSAPMAGGFIILRLIENRVTKATLRVWPTGKGLLTGSTPVVKALLARPEIRPWTDEDTASLL